MRAVIYARVSTASQRERDTIASQLSTLPEFVARQGWELVQPADTYVEDGVSGAAPLHERKRMQALLADASAGHFDAVVVVALDRLTRSDDPIERSYVFGTLQKAGVKIAESSTGIVHQGGTFAGDVVLAIGELVAVEEKRKIRERTMRGKDLAIARGRKPAGPTPYGLRYDRDTGAFSLDPAESKVVRAIFERVAAGESCAALELDLNRREVPTGAADRKNKATEWRRERIYNLIQSPAYRGEWMVDKRRRLTIKVPAIVDDLLWYRAKDALERWGRRGLRRTRHVYLCEEIARCAVCEARIGISTHGYSTKTGYTRHGYYVCGARRRPRDGERCLLPMRRVDEVDDRLWAAVSDLLAKRWPDLRARLAERQARAAADTGAWQRDAEDFAARLAKLDQVERGFLERYRRGRISGEALDRELDEVGRERAFLRAQVAGAQRALAAGRQTAGAGLEALEALRRLVAKATPDQRRRIVRAIIPGSGDYVVRLGPLSIEAKCGIWAASPSVLQGGGSSWRSFRVKDQAQPLVMMRLVA